MEDAKSIASPDELKEKKQAWSDYVGELLRSIFTTEEIPDQFGTLFGSWDRDPRRYLYNLKRELQDLLQQLRSIHSRLELFEEVPSASRAPAEAPSDPAAQSTRDIFVVHGHDEAAKHAIARFLEKLDLHPIILHEQPDKGRTIIQKFEDHSSVRFAVVLLTSDDEGRIAGGGEFRSRARQNVILELGYFIGKLGRSNVCALKDQGVEEPSDLHGVLYVPFDSGGAWRLTLARDLKAAKIAVDMNRAI